MFLLLSCVAIAILYILFDVDYFLRAFFILIWSRLFSRKKNLMDTATIYGICTTHDIDIVLKHMNNARYLRELDFARYYYYDTSRFYLAIAKRGGTVVQTASLIRYRKTISIFMPYKIITKLIYWEDKYFYMEQQFVGLTNNFIYAIVLSKHAIINTKISVQDIIADIEPELHSPTSTKELKLWLETIKESSQNLRKQI